MATTAVRATALRAGGACVRCRKGKTKCVYENGRAPCRNCAKGLHECYLPSESMSHGGHGVSPARVQQRARESLPSERSVSGAAGDRQGPPATSVSRHVSSATAEKMTPELIADCERVVSKTLPACVAFHKPSFIQHIKNQTLEPTIVHALLTTAARHSPGIIRRYGSHHHNGATVAAEHFASKTIALIQQQLDQPSLADIQALCLLVIHEWGSRNAVRAYIYLGQAARMAQMYHIVHQYNNQPPDSEQFLNEESFRRALWLIYILDCFLTSSPGRHPALTAHDISDVSLPCLDMHYHFGSPVYVRTLGGAPPRRMPETAGPLGEVGEFGHIVLATKAWRNVVEMMTTTTLETFSEARCAELESEIDDIRQSLPPHFADKHGQINVHITMGSGYTYAMIHCLLNCGTIFVNRQRILQVTTDENFSIESWNMSSTHAHWVSRILGASHSVIGSLIALEMGADKESILCFPIFMLFAAFTAGSTMAYLALKGLAPANVTESAAGIVSDSMRFCQEGANSWPLVGPWYRHLSVMNKVLRDVNSTSRDLREGSKPNQQPSPSIKEDVGSPQDTNPDAMDYDQTTATDATARTEGRESEPPVPRRTGFTTINGGSAGASTPATTSPPPVAKSPETSVAEQPAAHSEVDMTASELCSAFERQLLELDDLAAFMGGGV
ncbi:hypothetical protein QBC47DRAFT_293641 [Echria macrotheca]|uniref:Zn(2)-C6 fungal-type domain-containing protein n=1 Tax=Echria macrotheca TaxID=438768 RepID=A0AAJ0BIV7_9PEZI|nr:hypothetical protein QBC47DRAFT_293641 [Echria macrotheca]